MVTVDGSIEEVKTPNKGQLIVPYVINKFLDFMEGKASQLNKVSDKDEKKLNTLIEKVCGV